MNLFDNLQNTMFNAVTSTMGYDATWSASDGSGDQTARILFTGPTEIEKLKGADFDPEKLEMEYKKGDFAGLKELTDNNEMEKVTIAGIGYFRVKSVLKKYDGKTFIARLQVY